MPTAHSAVTRKQKQCGNTDTATLHEHGLLDAIEANTSLGQLSAYNAKGKKNRRGKYSDEGKGIRDMTGCTEMLTITPRLRSQTV